jgi:hypothetical protein
MPSTAVGLDAFGVVIEVIARLGFRCWSGVIVTEGAAGSIGEVAGD